MELKMFVSETLAQIIEGVRECQEGIRADADDDGAVNPKWSSGKLADGEGFASNGAIITTVEFDVAVTVSESSKSDGGAGISVVALKLGASGESSSESSTASRVRFSIPISLPIDDAHS